MPEAEVVSCHKPTSAVLLRQQQDEIHPRHRHHLLVKRLDNHRINRKELLHGGFALVIGGQPWHFVTCDKLLRGTVECKHRRGKLKLFRTRYRGTQQGLMSQMDTVKKTERDDALFLVHTHRPKKFLMEVSTPFS